jgi:hypothetical protein
VFVVTAARSGSTLLRYLMDSHLEITSPPELNLSQVLQQVTELWTGLEHAIDPPAENGTAPTPGVLSARTRRQARLPVDEVMATAAGAAGAEVYVDKSLTTVDHLWTVAQCYPEARLIFLYRYPLDMIASGLEASRWGFNAFGFAPFATARPGNFVAALADYWIDRASKMLAFERTCELPNARIYYELLCDNPAETLTNLFEFLQVAPDDGIVERMFDREHGRGPGDYKIDFSGSIAMDSIGRGAQLPRLLTEGQETRIDELLGELGYPSLVEGRRSDLAALLGLTRSRTPADGARQIAMTLLRRLHELPTDSLPARHRDMLPFHVIIRDGSGDRAALRLGVEGTVTLLDAIPDVSETSAVRCTGDILLQVTDGRTTFGRAVHDGLIRAEPNDSRGTERPRGPAGTLAAFAALLRAEIV